MKKGVFTFAILFSLIFMLSAVSAATCGSDVYGVKLDASSTVYKKIGGVGNEINLVRGGMFGSGSCVDGDFYWQSMNANQDVYKSLEGDAISQKIGSGGISANQGCYGDFYWGNTGMTKIYKSVRGTYASATQLSSMINLGSIGRCGVKDFYWQATGSTTGGTLYKSTAGSTSKTSLGTGKILGLGFCGDDAYWGTSNGIGKSLGRSTSYTSNLNFGDSNSFSSIKCCPDYSAEWKRGTSTYHSEMSSTVGTFVSSMTCTIPLSHVCAPVDGGLTDWSSICSASCTKTKTCTNPSTFCSGDPCTGTTTQSCTGGNCAPNNYGLTVDVVGLGTVTGTGIDCPGDCSESYVDGTSVTLTATSDAGNSFSGWSGACSGTGSCSVSMTAARSVTATFDEIPIGSCEDSQVILRLFEESNSHAALWDQTEYTEKICYTDIFDVNYAGTESDYHACQEGKGVLSLYNVKNSHVANWGTAGYDTEVCYGDLSCTVELDSEKDGCSSGTAIMSVFAPFNSHAARDVDFYNYKVCCGTGVNSGGDWRNLRSSNNKITEAQLNDTVLMDGKSLLAPFDEGTFKVYDEDPSILGFNFDDFLFEKENVNLIPFPSILLAGWSDFGNQNGEIYYALFNGANLFNTSNILVAKSDVDNFQPEVSIISIGPRVPDRVLKIAVDSEVTLNASAWDEDDFVDVTWTLDGDLIETKPDFAEIFNPDYSDLSIVYTFDEPGIHELCVEAVEVSRDKSDIDCVFVEVLCDGICLNAIISSPIDEVNTTWVRFDARNSTVYNCSNDMGSPDFTADIGVMGCVYIHRETQLGDDLEMVNNELLGETYSLEAEWFVDGRSLGSRVEWDEDYPNEYGYPYIFDWFFSDIDWHKAKLELTYSNL